MKKLLIVILFLFSNCSFDNKTGIWNNNNTDIKKTNRFKNFEKLVFKEKIFNQTKTPPNNLVIESNRIINNEKWLDEFFNESNNLENFSYSNFNNLTFKSKKLSRHKSLENILFDRNNIIFSDEKGNIIIYSIQNREIIYKYNFYKKKFKKIKKQLKYIVKENILYVADNLGYLYAINIDKKDLIWAKNYKVPFRSNLKVIKDHLVVANQNNNLFIINKYNGEKIKNLPTEEITLKNDFISSLSISKDHILFLNTYGSLYSLRKDDFRINWFVNLNQSLDINSNNLFFSNPLLINNNLIIISTDPYFYIIDIASGAIIFKIPVTSIVKPLVLKNHTFTITKDNLLVCIQIDTGEIVYSIDINQATADFLNTKKKLVNIKSFYILNNKIYIFLNNSYLIKFDLKGKIDQINKLPAGINSYPIFIDKKILFIDKKNRLVIID